jgi:hypothetical protein
MLDRFRSLVKLRIRLYSKTKAYSGIINQKEVKFFHNPTIYDKRNMNRPMLGYNLITA